MGKKVLVTGSLAFDYIMDFPGKFSDHIDPLKLHILNISFLVDNLKKQQGGTGGNIAFNLALLKNEVFLLAFVGSDFKGYEIFLKDSGVETKGIAYKDGEFSAQANIITDKKDNQITAFYPGAMKYTKSLSIKNLKEKFNFCVIAPNDPEAMIKFAFECQQLMIPYMFDPGMQLPRLSDDDLKKGIDKAEILIGNDYEMAVIKKRLNLSDHDLLGKVKILITTLGEKGSVIKIRDNKYDIAACKPDKIEDPTGAGDAFRAGFLAGYLQGLNLEVCGKMGSVAACYTVEKYGTTTHTFTIEEFRKRYKENFGEELGYEA